jgi:hypothetical protein
MLKLLLILTLLAPLKTFASEGTEGGGGGDLCEDRIKIIRDDIQAWIHNGGPAELKLPKGISKEQYNEAMLEQISITKISCVSQGNEGFPVKYGKTPKVCVFERNNSGSHIRCDFAKFNATKDSDQYVLIHHEYAGLSRIENPSGEDSNYVVSNQINDFLSEQIVKKLAIKKVQNGGSTTFEKLKKAFGAASKINIMEIKKSGDLTCVWANQESTNPQKLSFEVVGSDILLDFPKYEFKVLMLEDEFEHNGNVKYISLGKRYEGYFALRQTGKNMYLKFDIADGNSKSTFDFAKCIVSQ